MFGHLALQIFGHHPEEGLGLKEKQINESFKGCENECIGIKSIQGFKSIMEENGWLLIWNAGKFQFN